MMETGLEQNILLITVHPYAAAMSNNVYYINAQSNIAQSFERYAKIKTYGLHHKTDFSSLFARHLIITALLMDEDLSVLTDSEKDCLLRKVGRAKVSRSLNSGCNCS